MIKLTTFQDEQINNILAAPIKLRSWARSRVEQHKHNDEEDVETNKLTISRLSDPLICSGGYFARDSHAQRHRYKTVARAPFVSFYHRFTQCGVCTPHHWNKKFVNKKLRLSQIANVMPKNVSLKCTNFKETFLTLF